MLVLCQQFRETWIVVFFFLFCYFLFFVFVVFAVYLMVGWLVSGFQWVLMVTWYFTPRWHTFQILLYGYINFLCHYFRFVYPTLIQMRLPICLSLSFCLYLPCWPHLNKDLSANNGGVVCGRHIWFANFNSSISFLFLFLFLCVFNSTSAVGNAVILLLAGWLADRVQYLFYHNNLITS